jgi:hypothetical protein
MVGEGFKNVIISVSRNSFIGTPHARLCADFDRFPATMSV